MGFSGELPGKLRNKAQASASLLRRASNDARDAGLCTKTSSALSMRASQAAPAKSFWQRVQQVRLRGRLFRRRSVTADAECKLHELLQRVSAAGSRVVPVLQSGRHQPSLRQIRLFLRDGFQLATGLWVALQAQQYPAYAMRRSGTGRLTVFASMMASRPAGLHPSAPAPVGRHFRWHCPSPAPCVPRIQRAGLVTRSKPQAAQRYPGLGPGGLDW